jgi:hypothetical protein
MASTYSALKIELIATGEQSGTWGATTNTNLGDAALGEAITGSADVSFSSADVTVTLTDTNTSQTARNLRLNLTGTSGGARNLILGAGCQIEKLYLINNGLSDTVTVKNTTGTGVAVPAGTSTFVYNNGTNVVATITTATDNAFTIVNSADTTKKALFSAASVTTATTATFTLPAATTTLAGLGTTQTFSGATNTFSGNVSMTSSTFTRTATTQSWTDGSMTTGAWTVGGTAQTGAITLGRSTGAQTLNLATGATATATTKTINIGTAGLSGSTTAINIGSSVAGAGTNLAVTGSQGIQSITSTTAGQPSYLLLNNTADSSNSYVYAPNKAIGIVQQDTSASSYVYFSTQNIERARIDSSGNIGIGMTPTNFGNGYTVLQVANATNGGMLYLTNTANAGGRIYGNTAGLTYEAFGALYQAFTTNSSERMRIDSSGNVGIGTTSPDTLLNIQGVDPTLLIQDSDEVGDGYIKFQTASGTQRAFIQAAMTSNVMLFGTGTTERVRIDSSGNVGIGTSSPTNSKLDVEGRGRFLQDAAATTGAIILRQNSGDTVGGHIQWVNNANSQQTGFLLVDPTLTMIFGTSGTERMRIDVAGTVTMSAYGAGTATFSASGVISSVSDETWKTKDGVPVNPDAMLQKLEPGYWYYNEEKAPTFGQDRQLGFYAQNVHEAIGDEAAPTPEEGKPWGYYDRSVLAITVMSLKNALATIEELKQRITALENKSL